MNLTHRLAEALLNMTRALDLQHPGTDHKPGHWREPYDAAQATLAEYEAGKGVKAANRAEWERIA